MSDTFITDAHVMTRLTTCAIDGRAVTITESVVDAAIVRRLEKQLTAAQAENAELRAKCERLEADGKRLDWLEQTADGVDWQLRTWACVSRESIDRGIAKYAAESANHGDAHE